MKRSSKNKKVEYDFEEDSYSLKDLFFRIAGSFVGNFFNQVKEQVAERAQEILYEIKRTATVTFMVLFGVVFLFVGLANIIDFVVGIKGVGYLFVGFVIMFFGFFLNLIMKRK